MKKKHETLKMMFIVTFSFVIGGVVMFALLKWTPIISEVLGTSGGGTIVTKNETQVYDQLISRYIIWKAQFLKNRVLGKLDHHLQKIII